MYKPKLLVKEFLAHLRRQAVSEIISDEYLAALSNLEAQYGNKFTDGCGLEVRLGDSALRRLCEKKNLNVPNLGTFVFTLSQCLNVDTKSKRLKEAHKIRICRAAHNKFDMTDC